MITADTVFRVDSAEPCATLPLAKTSRSPTLLVVDDTPDNLNLIAGLFMLDYQVRVARDGRNALAICTSKSPPDLLLLDVMMPDMDGFELARHLRRHPAASRIPVIFITAMTDASARRQGLELGAVAFVTKPIEPELLQLKVKNQLRQLEQHKELQSDYDNLLALVHLREEIEQIARDDLTGPLSSILGLVRAVIEDGNLLIGQRGLLRLLEQNSQQLLDMLTLSGEVCGPETKHSKLQPSEVQVVQLLRRLVEITRVTFEVKEVAQAPQGIDVVDAGQADDRQETVVSIPHLDNPRKTTCAQAAVGSRVCIAV